MNGTIVDSTVVGGPAYNSQQIARDDVILKVDNKPVKNENVLEVLVGSDVPGSSVEICLAKGSIDVMPNHISRKKEKERKKGS
jgi:S1-C subfamily serine protease